MSVGALAEAVGLSQSALSQHLSLMRSEGLVRYRRDGQTLHYAIADPSAERLLATLQRNLLLNDPTSSPGTHQS